ncbi:type II toxin-antitoxin system RelE family toxin [Leptospira santarosai]|uniref:type II toxin-antitoxin system RelE family toxin n=1 Tax=Leptospira santarosai TaxID=28183 RepID=UPI0009B952B0
MSNHRFSIINEDIVEKVIKNYSKPDKTQIKNTIDELKKNGINHAQVEPLTGAFTGAYRMKSGNYRIMFMIDQSSNKIKLLKIGPRENFYKRR